MLSDRSVKSIVETITKILQKVKGIVNFPLTSLDVSPYLQL